MGIGSGLQNANFSSEKNPNFDIWVYFEIMMMSMLKDLTMGLE